MLAWISSWRTIMVMSAGQRLCSSYQNLRNGFESLCVHKEQYFSKDVDTKLSFVMERLERGSPIRPLDGFDLNMVYKS